MKTTKQEAQEIVDRFEYQIKDLDGEMHLSLDQARQCALIALDMVIESNPTTNDKISFPDGEFKRFNSCNKAHYQELKQEIEKL